MCQTPSHLKYIIIDISVYDVWKWNLLTYLQGHGNCSKID